MPDELAAGLSGAVNSTGIIVTAGMAEIAAGSIAMNRDDGVGVDTIAAVTLRRGQVAAVERWTT